VQELGTGAPLVLLHGLGATQQIWSLVVSALATERRVITLDLPGFGASAPVGNGFDLTSVAERVARALAAQRVRAPYDLVGHSLGGAVALTLAATRPRLINRLVLVAPAGLQRPMHVPPLLLGAGAEGLLAARRRLAALTDLWWGRRLLLAFAADDGARLSPAQARMMIEASAAARRISPAMVAIAQADLRPLLDANRVPLGLLWGARDRAVPPELARQIVAARPDAELEVIDRAGHVPMMERPDQFSAALGRLLDRLDNHATTSSAGARRLR
jgi:pimeloyl-ACP methyl ester carboxylesterase